MRRKHTRIGRELEVHANADSHRILARGIATRHEVAAQPILVVVEVEPPAIVVRDAPLSRKRGALDIERDARLVAPPRENARVVREVDAIVETPQQPVAAVLGIGEPAVEPIADGDRAIRNEIAVAILDPENLRRRDHERSALQRQHAARQHEAREERLRFVHAPVAVAIEQDADAPVGPQFVAAIDVAHVGAHLDDPHAARGVEHGLDRLLDQRLARHELRLEPCLQTERSDRLVHRQRARLGDRRAQGQHGAVFCGAIPLLRANRRNEARRRKQQKNPKPTHRVTPPCISP